MKRNFNDFWFLLQIRSYTYTYRLNDPSSLEKPDNAMLTSETFQTRDQ